MTDGSILSGGPTHHPRAWLEGNVDQITRIAASAARRHRLPRQDRQDLLSLFWTHLAKDDHRVLRQFRGSSGITTYLHRVVDRVVLDMRTRRWGKWRPSARARRLGRPAEVFERLVTRDGHAPDEAREVAESVTGQHVPREVEAALATRRSFPRRFVSLDHAAGEGSTTGDPFATMLDRRSARRAQRVGRQLEQMLSGLPAEDQQLLRMRHETGLKVSQMASLLGIEQKRLYRRLETIHGRLRTLLSEAGLSAGDVVELTSGEVSHVPRVLHKLTGCCDPWSRAQGKAG
jgi:RNA polymerase sigma factor (sigma-70 family)